MLTRKDYIRLAEIIRDTRENIANYDTQWSSEDVLLAIEYDIAQLAEESNPRFDRTKFYQASGLGPRS